MEKRAISSEEFIDRFVECLEKGEDFKLENCIVEGDIDILDIYEEIKKKIKDKEKLKELITKEGFKITINANISICIDNVEFKGNFVMYGFNNEFELINIIFNKNIDFQYLIFNGSVNFNYSIFNGDVNFHYSTFNGTVSFNNSTFNEETKFLSVIFNGCVYFYNSIFNKKVYFKMSIFKDNVYFSSIFNIAKFYKSIFKSQANFENIYFSMLAFINCIFEDFALFQFEKFKKLAYFIEKGLRPRFLIKNSDIDSINKNKEIGKEKLAIFLNTQFINKHTKIENFSLSKTSFLKTDVREVMILCDIKKEEILSHKILKLKDDKKNKELENKLKELFKYKDRIFGEVFHGEEYFHFINQFNYESVLAEYRNLRISIENNRTYEEASNLYKMEMELKKEFSKNWFEKHAIWFYGFISDYGESIQKPIIGIVAFILLFPLFALLVNYKLNVIHFKH